MEIGTIAALVLGNAAFIIPLFLWNRAESRTNIRRMDAKLESTVKLVRTIHDEVKDFYVRLCKIEERNRI